MTERTDVVVIGAGTAGAAAALHCARRGLSVVVLDRADEGGAGASWINGVPRAAFAEAGLDEPTARELQGEGQPMVLVAGWRGARLTVHHDLLELDMRRLVERLQGLASEAGAELRHGVTVRGRDGEVLRTSAGPVVARWVVDASGVRSVGLLPRPEVPPEHLCVAAQAVFDCADPEAARAWFSEQGLALGPTLVFTGIAGGFSILNVRSDGDEVSVLAGSLAGGGRPSGTQLLESFVAANRWIGARRFGGARAIPLRRPFDTIADDRTALLGDSASQVFSAHGSGIAAGLVAARMLAESLADGAGPRGYGVRWMRAHGGRFAAYDAFRRFSSTLTVDDLNGLLRSGLMDPVTSRAAVEQLLPPITPSVAWGKAVGAARAPRLAARMLPILPLMTRIRRLYDRYPDDPAGVPEWGRKVARLFDEAPDEDLIPR